MSLSKHSPILLPKGGALHIVGDWSTSHYLGKEWNYSYCQVNVSCNEMGGKSSFHLMEPSISEPSLQGTIMGVKIFSPHKRLHGLHTWQPLVSRTLTLIVWLVDCLHDQALCRLGHILQL